MSKPNPFDFVRYAVVRESDKEGEADFVMGAFVHEAYAEQFVGSAEAS